MKYIAVKDTAFLSKGSIVDVFNFDKDNDVVSFKFGDNCDINGIISSSKFEECFEKFEDTANTLKYPTITQDDVEEILVDSEITHYTVFDKCTVVHCKLPNGFVIVESSACVSPENYDEDTGVEICLNKIIDKVWELEAYRLQSEIYESDCDCCDGSCGGNLEDDCCKCFCDECPDAEHYDEYYKAH